MQVCRWGNGLAVRLSPSVVEALGLREGDPVMIDIAARQTRHLVSVERRLQALYRLRQLNWPLPHGFTFGRSETGGEN